VVTTERTIERCRRCGTERVVSENTEVAAVVDADDVDIDSSTDEDAPVEEPEARGQTETPESGGFESAIERSEGEDSGAEIISESESEMDAETGRESTSEPSVADDAARAGEAVSDPIDIDDEPEPSDPAEEDAEILTDDADEDSIEREPGEWPEESEPAEGDAGERPTEAETEMISEPDDEETLSGITVPEGQIACPECSFSIEASSGYRAGDPCPECNAWLEAERNQ
jgi:hypothetical protein